MATRRSSRNKGASVTYSEHEPANYAAQAMYFTVGNKRIEATSKTAMPVMKRNHELTVTSEKEGTQVALFKVKRGLHGLGLFAARRFFADDVLTRFQGAETVYNKDVPNSAYAMVIGSTRREPSPQITHKFAHFMNHSAQPNVTVHNGRSELGAQTWDIIANRDIGVDEQLFLHYGSDYSYEEQGFSVDSDPTRTQEKEEGQANLLDSPNIARGSNTLVHRIDHTGELPEGTYEGRSSHTQLLSMAEENHDENHGRRLRYLLHHPVSSKKAESPQEYIERLLATREWTKVPSHAPAREKRRALHHERKGSKTRKPDRPPSASLGVSDTLGDAELAPQNTHSEAVLTLLRQIKEMGRPTILVAWGGTMRYIAGGSKTLVHRIKHTGTFPAVSANASDYLVEQKYNAADQKSEKFPTLDNAMVQNWEDNPAMVSALTQNADAQALLQAVYGKDYRLVLERFGEQKKSTTQSAKDLQGTLHVDHPEWKKLEWQALPEPDRPELVGIHLEKNTFTIIILDQAQAHMIPTTGDSKTVYVGAVTPEQHAKYTSAVTAELNRTFTGRNQHLLLLKSLNDHDPSVMTAFMLLTGTRPVLHPSLKRVVMPAGNNGSRYKYFDGYFMPPQNIHNIATVLANIKVKHGASVHRPFAEAVLLTEITMCRLDPSALTTDTLMRYIGFPGKDIPEIIELDDSSASPSPIPTSRGVQSDEARDVVHALNTMFGNGTDVQALNTTAPFISLFDFHLFLKKNHQFHRQAFRSPEHVSAVLADATNQYNKWRYDSTNRQIFKELKSNDDERKLIILALDAIFDEDHVVENKDTVLFSDFAEFIRQVPRYETAFPNDIRLSDVLADVAHLHNGWMYVTTDPAQIIKI